MKPHAVALTLVLALGLSVSGADAAKAKKKNVRLSSFSSCSSLINYGNSNAKRVLGSGRRNQVAPAPGSGPVFAGGGEADQGAPQQQSAAGSPEPARAPAPVAGEDFSGTNVQEEGIDEPDIVKTDGERIFALAEGKLRVVDVTGAAPKLVSTLTLGDATGFSHEMLLYKNTLLVAYQEYPQPEPGPEPGPADQQSARPASMPAYYVQPKTILVEVDVSDPAGPKVVRSITTDGSFADARLNGRYARVVISTPPKAISKEARSDGTRSRKSADWRAMSQIRRGSRGKAKRKVLVRCSSVRRTKTFSGFGMISVVTFDLSKGLVPVDSDAVMSEAQTVYGSADSLYVATQRYSNTWAAPDGRAAGGAAHADPSLRHLKARRDDVRRQR